MRAALAGARAAEQGSRARRELRRDRLIGRRASASRVTAAPRPLGWNRHGCPPLSNAAGRQPPIPTEGDQHAAVLDRSELEASPLADLHAIADQLGLDGFRRLRKAELIDAILGDAPARRRRRRAVAPPRTQDADARARSRRRGGRSRRPTPPSRPAAADEEDERRGRPGEAPREKRHARNPRASEAGAASAPARARRAAANESDDDDGATVAEGVVEVLGNGSAFLRIDPPEPSDDDVYISAAQVRRCELVSGDRVAGPARTPRRSERYPSLVRVDTINGTSADAVSDGARYEDLPVDCPERAHRARTSKDPTLQAIEWLTPFGRGSRVAIVGAARAGKTETLRARSSRSRSIRAASEAWSLARARRRAPGGDRPVAAGPSRARAALSFAASSDAQGQAVERAIDAAKRVAARGGDAVVLIDSLDGLSPQAARKALAAARNLREGGSLTVIATARSRSAARRP